MIARTLLGTVRRRGAENGADHLWLEVRGTDVGAVQAYQRLGFVLCGPDRTLYRGTPAAGELALFMSSDVRS